MVLKSLAQAALQRLVGAQAPWFDEVDWAAILAAFAAEACPQLGSEDSLRPLAKKAVRHWLSERDGKDEPLVLPPRPNHSPQLKMHRLGGQAVRPGDWICSRCQDLQFARNEKCRRCGEPKSSQLVHQGGPDVKRTPAAKREAADDRREIDIDLGRIVQGESLGLSMEGLEVIDVHPGSRADRILARGDKIVSVNSSRVTCHEDFLRELENATPGQLRICVLPWSACRSSPKPPPPPPDMPVEVWTERGESASTLSSCETQADSDAMIVLNCEDIARCAKGSSAYQGEADRHGQSIPWEAVRRAIHFYEKLGFLPQPVCHQATLARCPPPSDLRLKLVQCPVVDDDGRHTGGRGSDRVFVINLAKTYDCPFVDNSNYREEVWCGHAQWPWLKNGGMSHKVEYIFDAFGEFLPSREVKPAARSARPTATVAGRLRMSWSEYGGR
eukprot:TRINITY_DN109371_c0_g1_i1.p1 TRINITY_DN109371_c0_g1~~TRINITY_DN109371_c0_g1_i1.p1  ORF type:complete len:508 (-),score=65.03 TRINITY_DN109371_c0_g1_i1:54-1382(-)